MKNYKFTIVIPHYDGIIRDEFFVRGIQSLLDQELQDFEVLIYHDGPTTRPIPDIYKKFEDRCKLTVTKKRKNDWGHSNRDQGIKEANGQYIVHFNPDNILYPFALKEIQTVIDSPPPKAPPKINFNKEIIVFPIRLVGVEADGRFHFRNFNLGSSIILTGYPAFPKFLDAMQVVISNRMWYKLGGWYDKSTQSDGIIYSKAISEYGARYCQNILGEHW